MLNEKDQNVSRRKFVQTAAVVGVVATLPAILPTKSVAAGLKAAIRKAGGNKAKRGRIKLQAPTIAENGAIVPVKVNAGSAADVKSVTVIIDKNPSPRAFTINFTAANGKAEFQTRVRMKKTSNVRAYAKMRNGKVYKAQKSIKVTIGGCG